MILKRLLLHLLASVCVLGGNMHAADHPPNIIFILAADLRLDDVGCYGADQPKTLTTPAVGDETAGSSSGTPRTVASADDGGVNTGRSGEAMRVHGPRKAGCGKTACPV